jgi:hypothetical protein
VPSHHSGERQTVEPPHPHPSCSGEGAEIDQSQLMQRKFSECEREREKRIENENVPSCAQCRRWLSLRTNERGIKTRRRRRSDRCSSGSVLSTSVAIHWGRPGHKHKSASARWEAHRRQRANPYRAATCFGATDTDDARGGVTSTVRSGSSLSLDVELGESVWSSSISRRRGTENEWTRWPRLAADASSSSGPSDRFVDREADSWQRPSP